MTEKKKQYVQDEEPELKILVSEEDGGYYADIHSFSDIGISVDLFGHLGHGKTKEEAIADFKKNIYELYDEVDRVRGRLIANIFEIYENGEW